MNRPLYRPVFRVVLLLLLPLLVQSCSLFKSTQGDETGTVAEEAAKETREGLLQKYDAAVRLFENAEAPAAEKLFRELVGTDVNLYIGNRPTPQDYLARVEAGESPEAEPAEVLDAATARGEAMFLSLRTRRGVDAAAFAAEFGGPPRAFFEAEIEGLLAQSLLRESASGDLRLTHRGRLVADGVFAHFVAA